MSAKTPLTETIILAAGETITIPIPGKYLVIRSCTAATFEAGFDNDTLSTFYAGTAYPSAERFTQVRFRDSLGAGCTIVATFADDLAIDQSVATAVWAAMAASLVNIDADLEFLKPAGTPTLFPLTTIAKTGVGSVHVVTVAADNKKVLVQADQDNAGSVYLGFVNTLTAVNSFARLLPGESWQEEFAGHVWACSENGTEKVRGYVLAT